MFDTENTRYITCLSHMYLHIYYMYITYVFYIYEIFIYTLSFENNFYIIMDQYWKLNPFALGVVN